MNKENIRKELKRLDSLIFEARMCLSTIEKEFYGSVTITNEYGTIPLDKHDESGEGFYEDQYTDEDRKEATLAAYNSTHRTTGQRNIVLPE